MGTKQNHEHTVSANSLYSGEIFPKYTVLKVYKKIAGTTEYVFPEGAIVMWDQATAPEGWYTLDGLTNCYIKLDSTATLLGTVINTSHAHNFSMDSADYVDPSPDFCGSTLNHQTGKIHHHLCVGATNTVSDDDWQLKRVNFRLIKKLGSENTWDGLDKYIYTLYAGTGTPAGFVDASTTYTARYIQIGEGIPTTGEKAGYAHEHVITEDSSELTSSYGGDNTGYHNETLEDHTHQWDLLATSKDRPDPSAAAFRLYKKLLGKMLPYNDALETAYTTGTWTSSSIEIGALSLKELSWNSTVSEEDSVILHTRTGSTKALCELADWSTGLTLSGSPITSTADVWFQYKIEFTASDTRSGNPRMVMENGFIVKFNYSRNFTPAETAVEFIYEIGYRHFDMPMADKIFKRITLHHTGFAGYIVYWQTEVSNGQFSIDMGTNTNRWDSFFQDSAFGRKVNLKVYKNDLNDLTLKELQILWTPEPIIV
jgi:hypothetical protein